ncbi:MAG: hypothetical protein SOH93_02890 [Oscillospiraceae bacterium]|jgi:hypothetical protein
MLFVSGVLFILIGIYVGIKIYRKSQDQEKEKLGRIPKFLTLQEIFEKLGEHPDFKRNEVVRLQGALYCDHTEETPLSGISAIYYESRADAMEKGGNEKPIFERSSQNVLYFEEKPSGKRIYLDLKNYGKYAQILPACFETVLIDSPDYQKFQDKLSYQPENPDNFRGFKVTEGYLPEGQTVFVKGRLIEKEGKIWIFPNARDPFFSYHQKCASKKDNSMKVAAIGTATVMVILGVFCLITYFQHGL